MHFSTLNHYVKKMTCYFFYWQGIYNLHLMSNEEHQCTEWLYVIFVQLSNVVVMSINRVPTLTGSQRSPALLLSLQVVGGLNALKLLIVLNDYLQYCVNVSKTKV